MNEKEIAYREGYAKGYQDAKKEERHGRWLNWKGEPFPKDDFGWDWTCSECKNTLTFEEPVTADEFPSNFCPNCGAIMDLPNITEQTENALRKLGEQTHGDN